MSSDNVHPELFQKIYDTSEALCDTHSEAKVWRTQVFDLIAVEVARGRVDENQSLLTVAEHEISLPNHCDMHDKYASQCNACKKRKWYGEISKDWKRVIEARMNEILAELEQLLARQGG